MSGIHYVFFTQFSITFVLAAVFFITWRFIERKPHTFFWFLAFSAAMLNMVINASRDLFPDNNWYWIIVNCSSLLVQGLSLAGFRSRSGMKPLSNYWLFYFLCVEGLIVLFTLGFPHMGLRMMFTPLSGAITMAGSIWAISKFGERLCHAGWGAVSMIGIHAVLQFLSAILALMQGEFRQEDYLELYREFNFLFMPAAFTGVGIFTGLLLANDLAMRMKNLAMTDQLTKLMNRRGFEQVTQQCLANSKRSRYPMCVVMADVDHFKKINDKYGHANGDRALSLFSKTLTNELRQSDIIGRLGGEEFAVLLQNTTKSQCLSLFERFREVLSTHSIDTEKGAFSLTSSFGIAEVGATDVDIHTSLSLADKALYSAKASGRDRVVLYQPDK
jgi:diguanylate cyclase (GGDEF)-like protein